MTVPSRREPAVKAANAHTSLALFHTIMGIAEGSDIEPEYQAGAQRIIEICKREAARCLADFDRYCADARTP